MNGQPAHRTHTYNVTPSPLMSLTLRPPRRPSHTLHPQTHASSRNSIHTHTQPPLFTRPPPAATRKASKQYFKLIQAIHHKRNIDHSIHTNTFPPGMLRQVTRLTDFIKPAAPTAETHTRISDNTTTWMKNNMTILHHHYTTIIHSLPDTPTDPLALQIAIGWARKRYSHKLSPETIHMAEHLLRTPAPTPTPTQMTSFASPPTGPRTSRSPHLYQSCRPSLKTGRWRTSHLCPHLKHLTSSPFT